MSNTARLARSFFFSLCLVALVAPGCGDDDGGGDGGGAGGGVGGGTGGGVGGGTGGGTGTDGGVGGGTGDDGGVGGGGGGGGTVEPEQCVDAVCVAGCDATLAQCRTENGCALVPADCAASCGAACAGVEPGACDCGGNVTPQCTVTCLAVSFCANCITECSDRKTACAACDTDHATCVGACPLVDCPDGGV